MTCPRCGSSSVVRNYLTVACLSCGHVLEEPSREVWDAGTSPAGGGDHLGPPWTEAELALWEQERRRTR